MTIKELAQDKESLRQFQFYITAFLEREAIRRVFAAEGTLGITDAKLILDGAIEQLENEYQPKPKKINLDNAR